jgi:hypothetical protein
MSHSFYSHPDPASTILPILASHVPQSIPLYRRIQYHLHYPSPTAYILASFPPSTTPADDAPWLVTHIDLSRGIETHAWLFSSIELSPKSASSFTLTITIATTSPNGSSTTSSSASTPSDENDDSDPEALATRDQLFALLSHIRTTLFPPHHANPSILYGSLHTRLRNLIPSTAIIRDSDIYAKHIFPPSSYAAPEAGKPDIPPGYRFAKGGILQKDLPLVLSRTEIPRTVATLATLPSVAVYTTDPADAREKSTGSAVEEEDESREPMSWAFLGLDASLTSLHVEPEHRGKRVGVDVARKIFRDGLAGEIFGNELTGLGRRDVAHSDVALYNQGSRRVMERLGGVPRWTVLWTEVDLEKLRGEGEQ